MFVPNQFEEYVFIAVCATKIYKSQVLLAVNSNVLWSAVWMREDLVFVLESSNCSSR